MLKARGQAERYVRALPPSDPNPPFLLVVDVGNSIEVFADFTQAGRSYLAFPDPLAFRIRLEDLRRPEIRERLRLVWTDPLALDPARHSAAVTCDISDLLAKLAKSLEQAGHSPAPRGRFPLPLPLLHVRRGRRPAARRQLHPPARFGPRRPRAIPAAGRAALPRDEHRHRRPHLARPAPRPQALQRRPLRRRHRAGPGRRPARRLHEAANTTGRRVEPAIFGTLLERALDPVERHKLGAHFTPRAYVERLVLPTVIEPLRAEWANVRAAAFTHARAGRVDAAIAEIRAFHRRLCALRILDPACGSGNFLYVTFELLKRLEGEILDELAQLGDRELALEIEHFTVDPHQFFGLELNPRAAAIAELVLWIGYLQWQARAAGSAAIGEPVLEKLDNIQCRDAVLAYDGEPQPVTWAMAAANPNLPGLPDEVRQQA